MKKFYVSLTRDLLGYFIEFRADSRSSVEYYLRREYYISNGMYKLPWCSVYTEFEFINLRHEKRVISALCGDLHANQFEGAEN